MAHQAFVKEAARQASEDVIERFGQIVLADVAGRRGMTADLWVFPEPRDMGMQHIRIRQSGRLSDVNLATLDLALTRASISGVALSLSLPLTREVGPDQLLARSDTEVPAEVRSALLSALRVDTRGDASALAELLDALDRLAMDALPTGGTELVGVLAAYEAGLESYAAVWSNVVDTLTPELLNIGLATPRSPLSRIQQSLGRLIEASPRASVVDDVYGLAYFPIRIARRAVRWRAPAYFQLLNLYPLMYSIAFQSAPSGPTRTALLDRSWRHLTEALWLVIPSLARNEPGPVELDLLTQARAVTRTCLANLMFATIETGDFDTYSEAFSAWRAAEE